MLHRQSLNYILLSVILDFFSTLGALYLAEFIRHNIDLGKTFLEPAPLPLPVFGLAVLAWFIIFPGMSVYDPQRNYRILQEIQRVMLSALLLLLVLAGALYFSYRDVSRLMVLYFLGFYLTALISWRVIFRLSFFVRNRHPHPRRRVVIVGGNGLLEEIAYTLHAHSWTGLELVGFITDDRDGFIAGKPVLGKLDQVRPLMESMDIHEVIVALPHQEYETLSKIVVDLQTLPLRVHVIPDYFNLALYRATAEEFGGLPLIHLRDPALTPYQRLVKRIFDIVVGALLLIAMLPLMAVVAVLVKLDSKGPVIFRQERVGENGKLFGMYKFRSMEFDAESRRDEIVHYNENGQMIHKAPDDPRVTRFGHFIRQTSIDELPQLLNVLKGEMSLVGPRPEMPWLVEKYEPWQRRRFAVPQGITGWWQINSRSSQPMHLHPEDDLYYIQNYSLLLDIQIMWKTVGAVLRRQGAF